MRLERRPAEPRVAAARLDGMDTLYETTDVPSVRRVREAGEMARPRPGRGMVQITPAPAEGASSLAMEDERHAASHAIHDRLRDTGADRPGADGRGGPEARRLPGEGAVPSTAAKGPG